ncbi:hypothetical protein EYF80_011801 [Liparis tanakae]|uniref:Uncharacterized protein n=1 Tax=Liparis tanakae TaxID=230148 RepID=A0A4Z2IJS6_9TELE|nr:hypothetical protein EYF80_011801 [Liparis tanakae]
MHRVVGTEKRDQAPLKSRGAERLTNWGKHRASAARGPSCLLGLSTQSAMNIHISSRRAECCGAAS